MTGVVQREAERRAKWERLGLPDPVDVLAAEQATRRLYDRDFRSPLREPLIAYFAAHPDEQPRGW